MNYIGIKFVDAVPMTADIAEEKGYKVSGNNGDGYEVTYEDGSKSWHPKEAFEKQYFAVKNKDKNYVDLLIAFLKVQLQGK